MSAPGGGAADPRVALVACSKTKLATRAPARDVYASTLFRLASRHAARTYDAWYVLSAEHGIVAPDEALEPYDTTLAALSNARRRAWGRRVVAQLLARHGPQTQFDLYAGALYRRYVIPELRRAGAEHVGVPLEGLRIGEQLRWLRQRTPRSFHFDLGDSWHGPIGLCARVTADSVERALDLLRGELPEELDIPVSADPDRVEYVRVYFNPAAISAADVDSVDDLDEADPGLAPLSGGTGPR